MRSFAFLPEISELFYEFLRKRHRLAHDNFRAQAGAVFLLFPLLLTACRGQSRLACCLSLRDIDANPDANVDGTNRACLDRMRNNSDTRPFFLRGRVSFFAFFSAPASWA